MSAGFNRQVLSFLSDEDWATVEKYNRSLETIHAGCRTEISRADFAGAPMAWMLVCIEQALRYRIASLADGMATTWNAANPLSATILGRSLCETALLVLHVIETSSDFIKQEKFEALTAFLRNVFLSTRDPERLANDPTIKAVNILTLIQKYNKKMTSLEAYYGILSERAHPNSAGHRGTFLRFGDGKLTLSFKNDFDSSFFMRDLVLFSIGVGMSPMLEQVHEIALLLVKIERERGEDPRSASDSQ